MQKLAALSALLLCSILAFDATSQESIEVSYGYEEPIKNAESPTYAGGFGEQISPVLGVISWDNIDLSIPLSGPDITLGRSLTTSSFYPLTPNYSPNEIYNWSLRVPKIYVNFWAHRESSISSCGMNFVKNIQVSIPGVNGFDPVGRSGAGITYPTNTAIHFSNNWLLTCETFSTRSLSKKSSGQNLSAKNTLITLKSPQGEKYHFRYNSNVTFSEVNLNDLKNVFKLNVFYITDIEDRFGNWITYDYKEQILNSSLDSFDEPTSTKLLLTKVRSSSGVDVSLTNDGSNITGISYGGLSIAYTPIQKSWSGPAPSQTVLDSVTRSDSYGSFTWRYIYSEWGQAAPSGYYLNKGLTSIENPWGGKVEYSYKARVFGCSKNHVDWPFYDYYLWQRTYSDPVNTHTVTYDLSRNYDPNYPYSNVPIDDFATTEIEFPDRKEIYEFHCARFVSDFVSNNTDHRLKKLTVKNLTGVVIRETEYEWDELERNYLNSSFIWHDSNGSNIVVPKKVTVDSNYITEYLEYDGFSSVAKIKEHNIASSNLRFLKYGYYNDQSNWLIGSEKTFGISATNGNFTTVSETQFHTSAAGNSSYANLGLPYRENKFGTWTKQYSTYHSNGDVRKIEFNQALTFGSGNRYVEYTNYKRGIPQSIKTPQSKSSNAQYRYNTVDNLGNVTSVTDFEGNCTNYTYNALNWLKTKLPCDSKWSSTIYNYSLATQSDADLEFVNEGMLEQVITSQAFRKTTYFDGMLRPILTKSEDTTDPNSVVFKRFNYETNGLLSFESRPHESSETPHGVSYNYDELLRLTTQNDNTVSGVTEFDYLSGDRVRVNDNKGNITTTTYLAFGAPETNIATNIQSPHSVTTDIQYNIYGNVRSISQGGITETRVYDSVQNLCKVVRPDVGNTGYKYNILGYIDWSASGPSVNNSITDCDNTVTTSEKISYIYDNLGNVETINYGDSSPDKFFTYDKNSNILNIASGSTANSYTYNSANQVESEIVQINSSSFAFNYDYDALQNLKEIQYPNNELVEYAPNALGNPTKAGSYVTSVKYHPSGLIKQMTYGNGFIHTLDLWDSGLPKNFRDTKQTSKAIDHRLVFDSNYNLMTLTDYQNSLYNLSLTYDGLDRLDNITDSYLGTGDLNYDGMGNILRYQIGNSTITYTYNTNKRLTNTSGSHNRSYAYDGRGNVSNNGERSFSFNLAQQLTSSTKSGSSITFLYDGKDKRVKKTVNGAEQLFIYGVNNNLLYSKSSDGDEINKIYIGNRIVAENKASTAVAPVVFTSLTIDGTTYPLYTSQQSSIAFVQNLDSDRFATMSWSNYPSVNNSTIQVEYKIDFGTSGNSAGNTDVNWTTYNQYTPGTTLGTLQYDIGAIHNGNVPSTSSTSGSDYAKLHIRIRGTNSAGNGSWRYLKPIWVYFND